MAALDDGADNLIIKPFEAEHVKVRITSTLRSRVHPVPDDAGAPLEVSLNGQMHCIPANQLRTPAILLSTVDIVVRKNAELQDVNERLAAVNEDLQLTVDKLLKTCEKLQQENAERR